MTTPQTAAPLPGRYYTDPIIYEKERNRIFRNHWQFVSHVSKIANRKDAFVDAIAQDGLIVRRGKDDELRAFYNVCRHRGAPLLNPGSHHGSVLRCPYHGWMYDDHGDLIATPRFNDAGMPEEAARLSLKPVTIAIAHEMVFARCDEAGEALDSVLAPVSELLQGLRFDNLTFDSTLAFTFSCNWKLYVENWLESYHFPWMHKSFTQAVNIDQYAIDIRQRAVCHRGPPANDQSVYAGAWIWLWPLTAWNSYDGGLSIERIIPEGPDRTRVTFTFLFAPEVEEDRREATRQMCRVVTAEDGSMCEAVHHNLRGQYSPGPLSPLHEMAITYFHGLVRAAID